MKKKIAIFLVSSLILGAGIAFAAGWVTCGTCYGSGSVTCIHCHGTGVQSRNYRCNACGGTGSRRCTSCGGQGKLYRQGYIFEDILSLQVKN